MSGEEQYPDMGTYRADNGSDLEDIYDDWEMLIVDTQYFPYGPIPMTRDQFGKYFTWKTGIPWGKL